MVAAWQENLPLPTASSVCVLGPAGLAGEARQGEVEIEGHEALGASVCAYGELQDLFKC